MHVTNQPLAGKLSIAATTKLSLASSAVPSDPPQSLPREELANTHPRNECERLPWLEAFLSGPRPKFGSPALNAHLKILFASDSGDEAISSLISSAFDALSRCVMTQSSNGNSYKESSRVKLWKVFIINRLPLLFQEHLPELPPATFEYALRKPLLLIDESALQILNRQTENEIDMMFSNATPFDIRRELLKSMVKCGLIENKAADRVLGAATFTSDLGISSDMMDDEVKLSSGVESIMEMINTAYDLEGAVRTVIGQVEEADCLTQKAAIDSIIKVCAL